MSIIQNKFIFFSSNRPPDIYNALGELQYALFKLNFSNSYLYFMFSGYCSNDIEPYSGIKIYILQSNLIGCNIFLKIGRFSSPMLFISSISIEKYALFIFMDGFCNWIISINKSVLLIS